MSSLPFPFSKPSHIFFPAVLKIYDLFLYPLLLHSYMYTQTWLSNSVFHPAYLIVGVNYNSVFIILLTSISSTEMALHSSNQNSFILHSLYLKLVNIISIFKEAHIPSSFFFHSQFPRYLFVFLIIWELFISLNSKDNAFQNRDSFMFDEIM